MTIRCSEVILPLRSEPIAMVAITSPLGSGTRTTPALLRGAGSGGDASHAGGQRLFASCLRRKVYIGLARALIFLIKLDIEVVGAGAAPGTAIGRISAR